MIRLLRNLFAGFLAVALIALAVLLVVVSTPGGSAWLLRTAAAFTDGMVDITEPGGTLLDRLTARQVRVLLPSLEIVAEDIAFRPFWPDLLRERVRLADASIGTLRIRRVAGPADADDKPADPVLLPVVIAVRPLTVDRLEILPGDGEPVVLTSLRLDGELIGGRLDFDELALAVSGVTVAARGQFGTGEPFALDADLSWAVPAAEISGQGTANGNLARLRLDQRVRVPDPVSVSGTLRLLDGAPRVEALATWEAIGRSLGDSRLTSSGGRLMLSGWTDAWEAGLVGQLALDGWPGADLRVRAEGDLSVMRVSRAEARTLGGIVRASGVLRFAEGVQGRYRLTGTGLNPAELDPRAAGRLDVEASGSFDAEGNFTADIAGASGTLQGRRFQASGRLGRQDGTFHADAVRVVAGPNRLQLDGGRWGTVLAGRLSIEAPDLPILWPGLAGSANGTARFAGTPARPGLTVTLKAEALAIGEWRLATLGLDGRLGQSDAVDVTLSATGLVFGERSIGDLHFSADGRFRDHTLALRLDGGEVAVALAGRGDWDGRTFAATLDDGRVQLPPARRWRLDEPLVLRIGSGTVMAASHCWRTETDVGREPGSLCADDLYLEAARQGGALRVRNLPVDFVMPLGLVPEGLDVEGVADLDAALSRSADSFVVALRWEQRDTTLSYRTDDGGVVSTRLDDFLVTLDGTEAALDFRAVMSESYGTLLASSARITDPLGEAATIYGRLGGTIPDLARLGPVAESLTDVADLAGRVVVDLEFQGPLFSPALGGQVLLADGALAVPAAGITVEQIGLTVEGLPDGRAAVRGSARSGRGSIELDGHVAWRGRLEADLRLTGENFEAIRLPEGTVQVSPDLTLTRRQGGSVVVRGSVLVPTAAITLRQIGEGTIEPSPDTVVHGREEVQAGGAKPALLVLDELVVRLGRDVRFTGFGLATLLRGELVLDQGRAEAPGPVAARGSVQVAEGSFTVFGEELTIDRGNLIFTGDTTDPGVDAVATRDITWEGRSVTVGVRLSGTLSRIQTTVYSEPAMGEMDALSYLMTGRPLSANSAGDRFSVSNAALTLGLQGALPVAQRLGDALKVDELGLSGAGGEGTELVVGERLGEDLYIRYIYGIFNKLGTIRATYRINRRLSLEASSGEEQALDLLYSVQW